MSTILDSVRKFVKEEEGASMVEYALMVALVAIVAIGGAKLIGTNLNAEFNAIASTI